MTDHMKIVYAYHSFEENDPAEAFKLLDSVTQTYYVVQFHKDIARALLCHQIGKTHPDEAIKKEAEFYILVYRLTKKIVTSGLRFDRCQYFYDLRSELFKDFQL